MMFPLDTPLTMAVKIDGFSIGLRMVLIIKEQDDYTICFNLLASDIHIQKENAKTAKDRENLKLKKELIMDWADCSNELPLLLGWKYTYPLLADLIKELEICDIAKAKAHPSNG
jgi:hypothetical protein